jgi:monovalent cation:proton antiporter-2 (CPA2) family protein
MNLLYEAAVFLGVAVLAVPLFSRLGLGSILGYLAAGILIGPKALGFISDVDNILHFSEFGVVLLLFLIGLELQPSRLLGLRRPIFLMGGAQVIGTGAILAVCGIALGLGIGTAIVTGLILALSSTAIVVQMLAEKGQLRSRTGRAAFSILLFQDIAVIPLLALMPLLASSGEEGMSAGPEEFFFAATAIAAVIMAGHFLIKPFLRYVVSTRINELFTISALFVVVGTSALMEMVGLSMALGAFLAGVLLSESEYRHALVADIEPFKGLLMGLFFVAVGMSVDLGLLIADPLIVAALTLGLLTIKASWLYLIGRMARLPNSTSIRLALALPQGGEFAFVLFTAALVNNVVAPAFADMMILVVTLTMIVTPLLHIIGERIPARAGPATAGAAPEYDKIEASDNRVIIAGFGRVGQIIGRILHTKGIPFTAVDYDFQRIRVVRRFGNKIYYGDLTRLWILRAAGAEQAEVLVLAMDDVDASVAVVELVRQHFPNLKIYARARDRDHAYRLIELGIDRVVRETFAGSLEIAVHAMQGLGISASESHEVVEHFQEHDEALLNHQTEIRNDPEQLIETSKEAAKQLESLFEQDEEIPADGESSTTNGGLAKPAPMPSGGTE